MRQIFVLALAAWLIPVTPAQQSDSASKESNEQTTHTAVAPAHADTPVAAAFELEDQFKETHSIAFPRERACVLLFADRDGSGQIDGWVRALYEQFKDSVDIHGVAQLKGVPPAMRPMIRYVFRQRVNHPVMLDWDGAASGKYACRPGQASVFVISPDGTITCTAYGAARGEELSKVTRATESLLHPPAPEKK